VAPQPPRPRAASGLATFEPSEMKLSFSKVKKVISCNK